MTYRIAAPTFALCAMLIGAKVSRASTAAQATSDNCYFVARRDILFNGISDPIKKIVFYQTNWLRAYRFIKSNPMVSRRFIKPRVLDDKFATWPEQLKKLGLTQNQIQGQPTYIYTLHLASYRKQKSLRSFINGVWLKRKMPSLHVYRKIPKSMQLVLDTGEVVVKDDPLFSERKIVSGKNFTRLLYGIYENTADASRDRKILGRLPGLKIIILKYSLSASLIQRTWGNSVLGGDKADWEEQ